MTGPENIGEISMYSNLFVVTWRRQEGEEGRRVEWEQEEGEFVCECFV